MADLPLDSTVSTYPAPSGDKPDTPASAPEIVSAWIEAIDGAGEEEKDWRDKAEEAVKAYRGDDDTSKRFNIYHANTETIVPALYNSTPVPDIRGRFGDDDAASKLTAQILERFISQSVDGYDFDDLMLACVRDMVMVSRGVARVRYTPHFDDAGEVADETVTTEYVPWRSFRRAPGRVWGDVAWIAFEHMLSEGAVGKLIEASGVPLESGRDVPFTYDASAKQGGDYERREMRFGKRARVWEVWDREKKQVIFFSPEYGHRPFLVQPDPLGLETFYPIPKPMNALGTTDSLIPVTSLSIYRDLLDELDDVTYRVARLVKQMRPRGGYAAQFGELEKIAAAGDGELAPLEGMEAAMGTGGDITKLIAWFPLRETANALKELRDQRESIKQSIYEITGISDIVRGASNPNETATAQQLKTQWGSLRVHRMQAEVARFARDIFRIKVQVAAGMLNMETLLRAAHMTDIPPAAVRDSARQMVEMGKQAMAQAQATGQPPPFDPQQAAEALAMAGKVAREEVEQILRSNSARAYRIDIESDSTVRGDLSRNQQQQAAFLTSTGHFLQAVGPAVMQGVMPKDVAIEIYAAFARTHKLGRQAEDALDNWAKKAKDGPQGGQQAGPDPAAEKAKADMSVAQLKAQTEGGKLQGQAQIIQLKEQVADKQFQRDMAAKDRDDQSMAFRAQYGPVATKDVGQQ